MSDIKRVVLSTLEPQKVCAKVVKKPTRTVRIRVSLPESNEDKCPEYNFKDELAAVKKKIKQNGKEPVPIVPNGVDPFGDENDEDVQRIALELEAKYGTGVSGGSKKRRKGRKDDYADIGAGYDESDSFIDNTDGYDEIIPHNVTTVRGGFYINSGALEFKTDDEATSEVSSSSSEEEESESEEEDSTLKLNRKRVLETSEEEEEDGNSNHSTQGAKKQEGEKPNISMQQAIQKKLFSREKIQIKKRKLDEQKNAAKELLRDKKSEPNGTVSDAGKDSLKENKKPMRLSSVIAAIDSVLGQADGQKAAENIAGSADQSIGPPNNMHELTSIGTDMSTSGLEIVKLPENLPPEILQVIESLKRSAKEYKDGGKVKFFSGDVNTTLLKLERMCKVLGRSSRVRVYEHLAPFVKCRKETLIKRAKNLVYEDENSKLKKAIDKLKGQIIQLMPALVTNHEKECQRILQRKFSLEAATNDEIKNLKTPRRKFPLHEEMKRILRDIANLKKRCLLHEGKSKNDIEVLLTDYLRVNILTLWPEGWMSMAVLKKFCTAMAIKTPDPKSLSNANINKHSQKMPAPLINYSSGNNITITPVNLTDKLNDVGLGSKFKPDVEVVSSVTEKPANNIVPSIKKPPEPIVEKIIMAVYKDKPDIKDNGVIKMSKHKEEPVIPKDMHCQIIDLTDTPVNRLPVADQEKSQDSNIGASLKSKFPALTVTPTSSRSHLEKEREDIQKVVESLKALQKLSSPSKTEMSNPAVSVIAFNKTYSNSNFGPNSGVTNNERTNFSGAIGFQDEFQKQFTSSLNNHKSPPSTPSSSGFNRCS
ncbi:ubinuclein-1 [Dendroctonus ponderosae]|uniref:ubinuclein-1 n=1 Tax=Dendroctonus ponderosae TaxID=77166 RepID=UPI002036341B|nr:ubinuclein-1 [Dendroctonus ponderosae]KAH1028052.1 hypothetical protein HUJ05_001456 [Dendroctonus ponderosae]